MPTDYDYTHLREDWVSPLEPVNGPAPFPWSTADRIAIHYTAALNLIDGDPGEDWGQLPAYLRAIQHDYLTNPARGYSIGYGVAVDQRGETWQLRGVDWKNAANLNWNHRTFTVLCLVDAADELRPPAVQAVRDLVAWFRSQSPFRDAVRIVGHRDIGATACPGNGVYAQITAGVLEPVPPPDEEVDVLEYVLVPKHPDAAPWWPWLACYSTGHVRPLGPGGPKVPHIDVSDIGQYRRICHAAGIQLAVEHP